MSVTSLFGVILFNLIFLFGPSGPISTDSVYKTYLVCVRVCCCLGIVQYLAQFAHVRLFTLGAILPPIRPLLVEANYNTEGIVAYGSSISRANGLFPLEPGGFSQLIAIALLIDVFLRRRLLFLPLYLIAYVLSYSGTGLLCLAVTLALSPLLAPRLSRFVAVAVVVAIPLIGLLFVLFPAQLDHLLNRSSELQTSGTSGYLRYVAQQKAWAFFSQDWRLVFGWGPGAFERFPDYIRGSGSAAVKLFAEYGAVGLGLFAAFLCGALWNRRAPILTVMMLAIYQLGGGNLLQPPTLILMALLTVWTLGNGQGQSQPSSPVSQPPFRPALRTAASAPRPLGAV